MPLAPTLANANVETHTRHSSFTTESCTMPIDMGQVSDLLSIIASAGQLLTLGLDYVRYRNAASPRSVLDEAQRNGRAAAEKYIAANPVPAHTMASMMSDRVVDAIKEKIEKISSDTADILLNDTIPLEEKEQRLKRLQREYCWFIWQSKNYNSGGLPDFLKEEWNKVECDQFKFI